MRKQPVLDDDELEDEDALNVQGWAKEDSERGSILSNCKRDGNSKSFIVTTVLLSVVILLLIVIGVYTSRESSGVNIEREESSNQDPRSKIAVSEIPKGAVTETFLLGATDDFSKPLEVPVQSMWKREVTSPRPKGNIAVHQIHLSAVDENYNVVPQHILYNHHSLIMVDGDFFSAFGAEGAQSYVSFPEPYAYILRSNQVINVTTMYLPLKSFAAMTPTRVFVNFTLVYTSLDDNEGKIIAEELLKWKPLEYDLTGIVNRGNPDFNIPGGGGKDSVYCVEQVSKWGHNSTIILVGGHIHIGGINITLLDLSNDNKTIVSVTPLYDSNGFVVRMGSTYANYTLVRGNQYCTIACYHNDRPFNDVMGLFQLYTHSEHKDNSSKKKRLRPRFDF